MSFKMNTDTECGITGWDNAANILIFKDNDYIIITQPI